MKRVMGIVLLAVLLAGPIAAETDYTIGPKDLLELTVFKMEELNTQIRVSSSGYVTLPLLGKLRVAGKSAVEVEDLITGLLRERYIKNPQVTVLIKEYISRRAYILGAVRKPGAYKILGSKNLVQLIAEAGGITDLVAGNRITVVRDGNKLLVDMRYLFDQYKAEANIPIRADDLVIIPQERTRYIYVMGQVKHPGLTGIRKAGTITLLEAIARAGGFTEKAARSRVMFHRKIKNRTRVYKVDVKDIISGKRQDPQVVEGDIIYVKESIF